MLECGEERFRMNHHHPRTTTGSRARLVSCVLLTILGSLVLLSAPSFTSAENAPTEHRQAVCPLCGRIRDPKTDYSTKAGTTLLRGATNTLFGWTEIIRQPAQEAKAGGDVATGLYHGITQGIARTVGGAGEMLTFWMPKVQDKYLHFNKDCPLCMGKPQPAPAQKR